MVGVVKRGSPEAASKRLIFSPGHSFVPKTLWGPETVAELKLTSKS